MSVDISDPAIAAVKADVENAESSTSWFLLQYGSSTSLQVFRSGADPVVAGMAEAISSSSEEVLFGYGVIRTKGFILAFLSDKVGGVRRVRRIIADLLAARAVVHARAVAQLFPLSDDLIEEKLGLTYGPSASTSRSHIPPTKSDHHSPTPDNHPLPPTPVTERELSGPINHQGDLVKHRETSPGLPTSTASANPSTSTSSHNMASPSTPAKPTLAPALDLHSTPQNPHPRVVSAPLSQGIASSDLFPNQDRSRKTSLSSRLGFGSSFGRSPSSPKSPSAPNSPDPNGSGTHGNGKSPNSPTFRFMNSNLVKNFGRKQGQSPPSSPGRAEKRQSMPPPLPPKDDSAPSTTKSPHTAPPAEAAPQEQTGNAILPPPPSKPASTAESGVIGTSPSAQQALFDISQRNVKTESEIQERFRRELGQGGNNHAAPISPQTDDEDIGLPYDRPDPDDMPTSSADVPTLGPVITPAVPSTSTHTSDKVTAPSFTDDPHPHQGLSEGLPAGDEVLADHIAGMDLAEDGAAGGTAIEMSIAAEEHARRIEDERGEGSIATSEGPQLPGAWGGQRRAVTEHNLDSETDVSRPNHNGQMEREGFPETTGQESTRSLDQDSRDLAEMEQRQATIRHQEEKAAEEARSRLEEQRREEQRMREEREAEEHRAQAERAEAERLRIQEEDRVRAEHEARVRQEEEERRRIEEERLRVEAERRRIEEEKQALEAEKQRLEDERLRAIELDRLEKERAETERKEAIRASLLRGKQEGGIMLSGWITVQTTKSTTWRRRFFHLLPHEMRLFKFEAGGKPIQTISLGRSAKLSQKYEESQVQASFKLIAEDGEEFFLYTDGEEEKETVLEGLGLILA